MSTGFGHGKIILVGEHAVVHGQPAVAAGLAVGITVRATPGNGHLTVPAWGLQAQVGDSTTVGKALMRLLDRLGARGFDFEADAAIPARAGLGSSAALSVAVARAAAGQVKASATDVADAVALAEEVFHTSASGIDAAAASSGKIGRFTKAKGWQPLPIAQGFDICVGLTGRPRDTAAQVATVTALLAKGGRAPGLIRALGEVADATAYALKQGDIAGLGKLLNIAHGFLVGLQISTHEIENMVAGAQAAGALGAKLTGAGGGGAIIALAPGREGDVLAQWRRDGKDGFVTSIGRPRADA